MIVVKYEAPNNGIEFIRFVINTRNIDGEENESEKFIVNISDDHQ